MGVPKQRKYKTSGFTLHYHGNYCGPNWNQGKYQGSALRDENAPPPVDEFDSTCMHHDDAYAINKNLKEADYKFFKDNIGRLGDDPYSTIKRNVAAVVVGIQGLTRKSDIPTLSSSNLMNVEYPPTPGPSRKRASSFSTPSSKRSKSSFSQKGTQTSAMKLRSGKLVLRPKKTVTFKKRKVQKRKYRKGKFSKKPVYKKIKRKIRKNNKYSTNGAILKVETGGVFQSGSYKTLYIGHGCSPRKVREAAVRSLFKELYKRAGVVIQDWVNQSPIQPSGFQKILVEYTDTNIPNNYVTSVYTISLTQSYNQNAVNWSNQLETDLIQSNNIIYMIRLIVGELAGNQGVYTERAVIRADEVNFDFEVTSEMRIQNRTQAKDIINTPGTQDQAEEQYTSITNNPLIGRMYQTKKWATGFTVATRGPTQTAPAPTPAYFQVLGDYGTISAGPSQGTNIGNIPDNIFQKPPPAWVFGSKDLGKIMIEPGQIKKAYFKFNCKISLNGLMLKCPALFAFNSDQIQAFGKCQLMGLEKLLDDRNEGTINIAISYELNQQYKCAFIKKRPCKSIPILEVTEGANNIGP
ncbi:MAG: putative capsid protein [CRESS virus sp. cte1G3]|uniref:Putative capsid protein n=1 Tax=CRESS virus sp. cte1G3 TaxID=2656683 RepID=A0A5Q2W5H5_9VIRU|nr:MAG: putative capsid protein [CRESS virus sp. cte1G3]